MNTKISNNNYPINTSIEEFIIRNHINGSLLQVYPLVQKKYTMFITNTYNKLSGFFKSLDISKNVIQKNMNEGTVKFFNVAKGFGFITNGNVDIFVHASGLKEEINQNDEVTFDIERSPKGLNAINVRLAK